ncbi:hypothetical protein LBMAG53_00430 [Planctomycetota bacterium]|nr:hypothetical protein LBMAG53_00430 [Planctomycetota bacterium]
MVFTMILRLQHLRPDGELDTYHLKSGRRYTIGRGSTCEVRILDLKLSRQHCAIEYTTGEWRAFDLGSTNGCKIDGDHIAGSAILQQGTRIDMGQTTLTVHRILDEDEVGEDDASPAAPVVEEPVTKATVRPQTAAIPKALSPSSALEARKPVPAAPQQPPVIAPGDDEATLAIGTIPTVPAVLGTSRTAAISAKPTATVTAAQASAPATPPPAAASAPAATPSPAAVSPATPTPAAAASAPAGDEARTFHITVLGRRVGPLTRTQARELKARELKGTLTVQDLASLPQG